jgi:hypothetical protein
MKHLGLDCIQLDTVWKAMDVVFLPYHMDRFREKRDTKAAPALLANPDAT